MSILPGSMGVCAAPGTLHLNIRSSAWSLCRGLDVLNRDDARDFQIQRPGKLATPGEVVECHTHHVVDYVAGEDALAIVVILVLGPRV
jgi:hypothetical protein